MKNLLFLVLFAFLSISSAQIPTDGDSIYYSPKFCNTASSVEDCYESWIWSSNIGDCYQAGYYGPGMCDAIYPGIYILDSYECCCQVASTPGMESAWAGFEGSLCEQYLYDVGFISIVEN